MPQVFGYGANGASVLRFHRFSMASQAAFNAVMLDRRRCTICDTDQLDQDAWLRVAVVHRERSEPGGLVPDRGLGDRVWHQRQDHCH